MRKIILVLVIALVALGVFVHGACDDYDKCGTQEDRAKWLDKNIGIKIVGDSFYYNKESNSLTLTFGSSAEIPADFLGKVRVVDATATLKDSGAVFKGKGTYSKQLDGFSIEKGTFNSLPIENSNGVKYNKYSSEISGVAGDNSRVLEQKIGKNTKFFYNEKTNTIRFEGNLESTTLPDANIVFDGKGYKFSKSDKYYIDFANSKTFALPRQEGITFDGIKLMAENRPVRFSFVEDDLGYTLTPVKNFVVLGTDKSISDVFKEAGYGGNNFEARKIKYEETFPGETYRSANNADQNIKLLNALKNGEAELQYKDSNVQIRVPNDKVSQTLTEAKPKNQAEYGKLSERFSRVDLSNDPLEKIKLPNGMSISSAIEEIVNENNADQSRAKIDPNFFKAKVLTESGGRLEAINKGKGGIMSWSLGQATDLAVLRVNEVYGTDYNLEDYKKDPMTNLRVSVAYLSHVVQRCDGDERCGASAYNIGETTGVNYFKGVKTITINERQININGVKGEIHPGTKAHVAKVFGNYYKYYNRNK